MSAKANKNIKNRKSSGGGKKSLPAARAGKKISSAGIPRVFALTAGCLLAALLLLVFTTRNYYFLTLLCCLYTAALLWWRRGRFKIRCTLPVILLSLYVLFVGVSALWAESPSLFIEEYAKLLLAFSVFLSVLLLPKDRAGAINRTLWLVAGTAAAVAFLSVEAATSGILKNFTYAYLNAGGLQMGFKEGTRLSGMFGSPNVFAGILAIGVLVSISLAETAAKPFFRAVAMALLSLCAYTFLLAFSLGGMVFFALSIIVYLFAARDRYLKVLRIMLIAAAAAVVCAYAAFPCFNSPYRLVPLILTPCNAAAVLLADRFLLRQFDQPEKSAGKRPALILGGIVVVLAVYLTAAFTITDAYSFHGASSFAGGSDAEIWQAEEQFSRSAYLEPGDYALQTESDGAVQVTVRSQNREELLTRTSTVLYEGDASEIVFSVPGDSLVCFFDFSISQGVTLSTARLSDGQALKLHYPLLPGFVANRLQGLFANQNAVQRLAFFEDGMKVFRLHPLLGGAPGCFEANVLSVQSFYYSSRYVHNHYIQLLSDNGIAGLLLGAGFLVLLFLTLLKRRFRTVTPAFAGLLAAMVMICGHAVMEASFSFAIYLPFAYALFAVISFPTEDEDGPPAAARAVPVLRWVLILLSAVYAVFFILCIAADSISGGDARTYAKYLQNQRAAASIDIFNRNDYRINYINGAVASGLPEAMEQAGVFVDALPESENSSVAVKFYLSEGQYEKALSAAETYLDRMPFSESAWKSLFGTFSVYYDSLEGESGEAYVSSDAERAMLTGGILALYDRLAQQNAGQIQQIDIGGALALFVASLNP